MKLSACIEMLFTDAPFEARIALAKQCGFDGFEFWGWVGRDVSAIADAQAAADIQCAALCVGTRDAARQGEYSDGCMLKAKNAKIFAEMLEETIETIKPIGCETIITTTGQELLDVSRESQQEAVIACLNAAAPIAEKARVTLILEPLNILVDHKGYYLSRSDQAFEILRAVNSPAVKLLYDIYHQQITEGNLIQTIRENIDWIGHFHLADVPGRNQPGVGEINYDNVFAAIASTPYQRFVGCEYRTTSGVTDTDGAKLVLSYAHR